MYFDRLLGAGCIRKLVKIFFLLASDGLSSGSMNQGLDMFYPTTLENYANYEKVDINIDKHVCKQLQLQL